MRRVARGLALPVFVDAFAFVAAERKEKISKFELTERTSSEPVSNAASNMANWSLANEDDAATGAAEAESSSESESDKPKKMSKSKKGCGDCSCCSHHHTTSADDLVKEEEMRAMMVKELIYTFPEFCR